MTEKNAPGRGEVAVPAASGSGRGRMAFVLFIALLAALTVAVRAEAECARRSAPGAVGRRGAGGHRPPDAARPARRARAAGARQRRACLSPCRDGCRRPPHGGDGPEWPRHPRQCRLSAAAGKGRRRPPRRHGRAADAVSGILRLRLPDRAGPAGRPQRIARTPRGAGLRRTLRRARPAGVDQAFGDAPEDGEGAVPPVAARGHQRGPGSGRSRPSRACSSSSPISTMRRLASSPPWRTAASTTSTPRWPSGWASTSPRRRAPT